MPEWSPLFLAGFAVLLEASAGIARYLACFALGLALKPFSSGFFSSASSALVSSLPLALTLTVSFNGHVVVQLDDHFVFAVPVSLIGFSN